MAPNSANVYIAFSGMMQVVFIVEFLISAVLFILIHWHVRVSFECPPSLNEEYLQNTSSLVSQKTVQMQRRLYRIFLLRLLVTIISFHFPFLIIGSRFLPDTGEYPLQMIRVGLMALHCPLQSLVTVFSHQKTSNKIQTVVSTAVRT